MASNEFLINKEVIAVLCYYVVTTCTDKPISEVERETALQNLFIVSRWQCTRPSTDSMTGETGG